MGKSIGIDLGTTNSVVAYYDGGRSLVLRTRDEMLTPSVVSYHEPRSKRKENQEGTVVVGKAAVANALKAPENTIFSIKRLMGRTIDEEKVQEACKQFGYTLLSAPEDPDRSIRIKLYDKEYTPVAISAMILAQLKEDAEKALGAEVTHAVITVPAYFEERQRAATREAGQQAGLIVKQIIDEPTAAAIAFGFEKPQEKHRVLVYDMGGGTFDVSLVQMMGQKFRGLTIEGDMWLGGDDFDYKIIEAIVDEVRAEADGVDPLQDKRFLAQAKQKAEEAKIALSGRTECDIACPAILRSPMVDLEMSITREEFNDWIRPYVDRSMDLVRQALRRNDLTPEDITTVLMVGGATATPLVYEAVTSLFGAKKVRRDIDPMHCVAIGASIMAAHLDSIECPKCLEMNSEKATICSNCGSSLAGNRVKVDPVTARSLGIGVIKNGKPDSYVSIIPKDTRYPLSKAMERTFFAGAKDTIKLSVYEGEETVASLNERQGDIEHPLPEEIPVGTPVRVSFDFDKDRLLKVAIHIEGYPHLKKTVTLDRSGPLGPMKRPKKERSWREEVQKSVSMSRRFLSDFKDFVDPGQAAKMEADVQKAEELSKGENEMEAERVMHALDAVLFSTSGVASLLFLAEMAINRIEDARMENQVRTLIRDLRNAAKQNDRQKRDELSQSLRIALRVTTSFIERAGPLPVEDQIWHGVLRIDS